MLKDAFSASGFPNFFKYEKGIMLSLPFSPDNECSFLNMILCV